MNHHDRRLQEALEKIAEVANTAVKNGANRPDENNQEPEDFSQEAAIVCTPKFLPRRLALRAAETASRINPVNAPMIGSLDALTDGFQVSDPLSLAAVTAKYWGPSPRKLSVSFLETTPADLRARIISHMNAWTKTVGISFLSTNGTGDVRISRGPGGYYSYLGTDILHIPKNRQTMNLEGFTMNTPESEYKRVVRHETGHTLGFPHEHMRSALVARIVPAKAYKWFWDKYRWDKATVDAQVLRSLDEATLMSTPADQTSIMCYQLPGEITKDGKPIIGGLDINQTDYTFAGRIYPKPGHAASSQVMEDVSEDEWAESEDVEVGV